ncbi:MAG TPA: hypothetical protein VK021_09400 [Flavobacteriaceae bacterium]|nr:hypothetical protein [Flavobacteriaceae bacterium]
MKTIKIILIAVVIGVIGFFAWKWTAAKDDGKEENTIVLEEDTTEEFIGKIDEDIEKLKNLSKEDFSKSVFKDINDELKYFYDEGELGKDSLQNAEEYKNLSKTLFAAYVPMFIDEADYKLRQPTWKNTDLKFIRNEIKELRNNKFFDTDNSNYNSRFDEIENTISKYYEVADFINQSKQIPSNLDYSVDGRFPIDEIEEKIAQSELYLYDTSNHIYISNVRWMKDRLEEVPLELYQKNLEFLKTQFQENIDNYQHSDLASQAEYSRQIYQPLKRSLDEFDNDIYDIDYSEFRLDYRELKELLDNDNDKARKYFKEKWEEEMKNRDKSSED